MNEETLGYAMYFTANSIAKELLKNTDIRSEMISAQELINLQMEVVIEALTIVMLRDQGTNHIWEKYFQNKDLIETLTQ